MKIKDEKIILLDKQINNLAKSIEGLATINDETLNTTIELTKHITSLQEDFITVVNRLNEVELSIEEKLSKKELFVSPVLGPEGEVETPYPEKRRYYNKKSKIQRVVTNLKRLIRANAAP